MRKLMLAAAVAALSMTAGSALAQRGPTATIYAQPNFQGPSMTVNGYATNLPSNFNDKALSIRVQGRWRVCQDSDYRGRCVDVSGDIPNLNSIGMAEAISSLQAYSAGGGPGQGGPGYGGPGYGGPGYGGPGGGYRPGGGFGSGSSGWRPGGNWGGPSNSRPVEGARHVLFPYPSFDGYDIAAGSTSANAYCRYMGLGSASYYDSSQRANQAVDADGRYTGSSSVLRDLLCRKY